MAQETITSPQHSIDSVLQEARTFDPPPEFRQKAHIRSLEDYERLYKEAAEDW